MKYVLILGEKKRFGNSLLLVQRLCEGPFLYQQCSNTLNLVSKFSHICGGRVCVCARHFQRTQVSADGQHVSRYAFIPWPLESDWLEAAVKPYIYWDKYSACLVSLIHCG